jgi:flagellum-specific ATP synthase
LINVGAYSAGTDPVLDEAIRKRQSIESYLQQDWTDRSDVEDSVNKLSSLFTEAERLSF